MGQVARAPPYHRKSLENPPKKTKKLCDLILFSDFYFTRELEGAVVLKWIRVFRT
jgi:hypothetical protein